jgi:hypothetical protein
MDGVWKIIVRLLLLYLCESGSNKTPVVVRSKKRGRVQ